MTLPIKATLASIPGGMRLVPLRMGDRLDTLDQKHRPFVEASLKALGASTTNDGP